MKPWREEKLTKAMESIAEYIEKVKPKTLDQANHMLALISVLASETLEETKDAAMIQVPPSFGLGEYQMVGHGNPFSKSRFLILSADFGDAISCNSAG